MSTDLKITSLQPPDAVGLTHASSVIPAVRSSEAESLMETSALVPLNPSPFPHFPVTQVAPLMVPEFPFPEIPATVLPLDSSNPYAATNPSPGRGVVAVATLEKALRLP